MKRELKFCKTCNARERVIQNGVCVICGCNPATDPPSTSYTFTRGMVDRVIDKRSDWPLIDKYVFGLCVVATLYIVIQVALWIH